MESDGTEKGTDTSGILMVSKRSFALFKRAQSDEFCHFGLDFVAFAVRFDRPPLAYDVSHRVSPEVPSDYYLALTAFCRRSQPALLPGF